MGWDSWKINNKKERNGLFESKVKSPWFKRFRTSRQLSHNTPKSRRKSLKRKESNEPYFRKEELKNEDKEQSLLLLQRGGSRNGGPTLLKMGKGTKIYIISNCHLLFFSVTRRNDSVTCLVPVVKSGHDRGSSFTTEITVKKQNALFEESFSVRNSLFILTI